MNEHDIKSREDNLKLYYDIAKQDFNIMLTSTIPTQKSLMKTILWVNVTILGASATVFNYTSFAFLLPSISFSTIAILLILVSLKYGRNKKFAHPAQKEMVDLPRDEFTRVMGLNRINKYLDNAIKHNSTIIVQRGQKLSYATNFSIASVVCLIVSFVFFINSNLLILHPLK
jgi:protein-S-isoprenylcysteine O-methyltransferase Ste14